MNLRIVRHVFVKDGRELLRDRRTLFVNFLLPTLLYPLLAVAAIQALQVAKPTLDDLPVVGYARLPEALNQLLDGIHPSQLHVTDAQGQTHSTVAAEPDQRSLARGYRLQDIQPDVLKRFQTLVPADDNGSVDAPAVQDETFSPALQEKTVELLRQEGLAILIFGPETAPHGNAPWRYQVLADNAHPFYEQAYRGLSREIQAWKELVVQDRLKDLGLQEALVEPLSLTNRSVATRAEASRSRIGGLLPILLIILALVGCFWPALDLIAGERERGTLETLCSLPADRRDLVVGKLLVVFGAGLAAVVFNLVSMGVTMAILLATLPATTSASLGDLGMDTGVLLLGFVTLVPICITLAAVTLGVAGLANSYKEAQNYLTPVFLVVILPVTLCAIPTVRANFIFDLVPILGPALAFKACLQEPSLPWGHLALAFIASTVLAVVVTGWCTRLLESERFLFPGLVRAGWGRFRTWGVAPKTPGGLESLGVYALALTGLILTSLAVQRLHPFWMLTLPLVVGIGMPVILHQIAGAYPPREIFFLRAPVRGTWVRIGLLVPVAFLLSVCAGLLQEPFIPTEVLEEQQQQMGGLLKAIHAAGGFPLLVLGAAIVPGIFEELLCRGTLLSGLRRSLGPRAAILLTALCFAAMHLSPYRFISQFLLGALMAAAVLRFRSILPAMIIHAIHNAAILTLSGGDADTISILRSDSPYLGAWLTTVGGGVILAALAAWLLLRTPAPAEGTNVPMA